MLAVRRVYLVLHHILKELSSKRLLADQKNFEQVGGRMSGQMGGWVGGWEGSGRVRGWWLGARRTLSRWAGGGLVVGGLPHCACRGPWPPCLGLWERLGEQGQAGSSGRLARQRAAGCICLHLPRAAQGMAG